MKKLLFLLTCLYTFNLFSQFSIEGKVIDGDFNDVLPFANIQLLQINNDTASNFSGTTSDFDGKFIFEDLASGQYELEFSFVGYETKRITEVFIGTQNPNPIIEIVLASAASELEEVVVTTSAANNTVNSVLNIQKKSAVLIDGLSLQSIRKAGDNDIASAIRRVPGISIDAGKYVYVRGLGDRYSKTLLNGLEVPGLDPDRNTLQLDIFPTNLIENIQVVKSASAKLDADFTGGIVDIQLKDFANSPEYSVSFGTAYNPAMHFNQDYIRDQRSETDFLGFDTNYRNLRISRTASIPQPSRSNPKTAVITNYTQLLNKNLEPISATSFINYNFGINTSNKFDLGNDKKIGYIASLNYRSNTSFYDDFLNSTYIFLKNDQLTLNSKNEGLLGTEEKFLNFLTGLTFSGTFSKFKLNFLLIQNGESNVRQGGFSEFVSDDFFGEGSFMTYTQRTILTAPFSYKLLFNEGKSNLELKGNVTKALVEDKDFKVTVFEIFGDEQNAFKLSPNGAGFPQRLWRDLEEDVMNFRLDYTTDLTLGNTNLKVEIGAAYLFKNRVFGTDIYTLNHVGSNLYLNGQPNNILRNENIWTFQSGSGSYVYGNFQEENQFDSTIKKSSAYASSELNISPKLKGIFGLRLENYRLFYTGQSIDNTRYENAMFIDRTDFFPSANLIYSVTDEKKFRLSSYTTTARPSFKESSTAVILDPITLTRFYGNVNLKPSIINNFDLRFENYRENGEFTAVSGFYKIFQDPIEIVLFDRSTPDIFIARNNPKANVFGVEIEKRKNLIFNNQHRLFINTNISFIESRQVMGQLEKESRLFRLPQGESLKDYRKLQGQAPYILNAGINYVSLNKNIDMGLFFNRQGKTLQIVGNDDVPDVFTVPFNSFNFTFEKKLSQKEEGAQKTIRFKVNNILNDKRESQYEHFDISTQLFQYRNLGRTFSLNYNIKF
ncbi:MAG: TonB-dependent receptor domain-containing protein [Flavobacteriaceae bacterium]